jgi:hypothetical protein
MKGTLSKYGLMDRAKIRDEIRVRAAASKINESIARGSHIRYKEREGRQGYEGRS